MTPLKATRWIMLSALLAPLICVGCADSSEPWTPEGSSTTAPGGTTSANRPAAGAEETRGDVYAPGLSKFGESATFQIVLLESSPTPRDTGKYTWRIEVRDSVGQSIEGAEVVAEPTMPQHGHGTYPTTTPGTPTEVAGEYLLEAMDLFMPGLWHVEIDISWEEENDRVVFRFDLEG